MSWLAPDANVLPSYIGLRQSDSGLMEAMIYETIVYVAP